jgi:hypothetical protein
MVRFLHKNSSILDWTRFPATAGNARSVVKDLRDRLDAALALANTRRPHEAWPEWVRELDQNGDHEELTVALQSYCRLQLTSWWLAIFGGNEQAVDREALLMEVRHWHPDLPSEQFGESCFDEASYFLHRMFSTVGQLLSAHGNYRLHRCQRCERFEYTKKRAGARFCSDECRAAAAEETRIRAPRNRASYMRGYRQIRKLPNIRRAPTDKRR